MTRKIAAVAIAGAFVALGIACSSSSSSGPGGTLQTCGGTGTGTGTGTESACGTCTQSKCSNEMNTCFASGGQCSTWTSGGCKGIPDATCSGCVQKISACQSANCATECGSSTTDSGVNDGFTYPDSGTPTTPNCVALAACCNGASFPASAKSGCNLVAGTNDDATCKSALDGYTSAGYCK